MRRSVRADELVVGDRVVLSTPQGDRELVVTERIPRAASIKFVGRARSRLNERGGETHWGWAPDDIVTRVKRAR